jgi:2,3,4,5-tetrahydropyridine-2-carboxylate N-succinyltransferase
VGGSGAESKGREEDLTTLARSIETSWERAISGQDLTQQEREEAREVFAALKRALNTGQARAATRNDGGRWEVHPWVKQGILLGFRLGEMVDCSIDDRFRYFDKETYPTRALTLADGVRIVPGGTSIRDGACVERGVTIMPPAYINTGSFVGAGTMVDSHALIGSCAQIGRRCHISAAAQIGGVLEPVGALPVIIEDDVLIGGNCGIYEGTIVRERAVIGAGVTLTGAMPLFDAVRGTIYRREEGRPLEVPSGAVVVPGSRLISSGPAKEMGLSLYAPIIIKYRDEKTDASVQLEEFLR